MWVHGNVVQYTAVHANQKAEIQAPSDLLKSMHRDSARVEANPPDSEAHELSNCIILIRIYFEK